MTEAPQPLAFDLQNVSPSTRLNGTNLADITSQAGFPLVGDAVKQKALRRTLKTLADWMVLHAAEAPRLPQEDVRAIAAAFRKLQKVHRYDVYAPNTPPQIPESWASLMEQWISKETAHQPAGAPTTWFDQWSYPRLLGFFIIAYGKKPTATLNGPAHRFLISFFAHLQADVLAHYSNIAKVKERVRQLCKAPSAEALRRRLREISPDTEWVGHVLAAHEARLIEYNPPNHW